ncbi:MAG: hypothetical protein CSA33_08655 [Desulfobulbus propionicus]|nr:MAG: hypothetical protein CSA33_08655 [Desulfobulbus propionicus]
MSQIIAWNGIAFQTPENWTPVTVFQDYLLFEQGGQPNLGIRWLRSANPLLPEEILNNLVQSNHFALHGSWSVPQPLQDALPDVKLVGFIWSENRFQGQGLVAMHPSAGWSILLQMYDPLLMASPIPAALLRTIRFSGEDMPTDYALFDISLQVPPSYILRRHSFLPSQFQLEFSDNKSRLFFYRFKPATVFLQNQTLYQWGQQIAGDLPAQESKDRHKQIWEARLTGTRKYLTMLRRKPLHQRLELSLYTEKNCILGIGYHGPPCQDGFLNELYARFSPHR